MMISNQALGCLHCPGSGDEDVGPLALASIDLLTVAVGIVVHPGVATILLPATGAEAEGSLVLADDS